MRVICLALALPFLLLANAFLWLLDRQFVHRFVRWVNFRGGEVMKQQFPEASSRKRAFGGTLKGRGPGDADIAGVLLRS